MLIQTSKYLESAKLVSSLKVTINILRFFAHFILIRNRNSETYEMKTVFCWGR